MPHGVEEHARRFGVYKAAILADWQQVVFNGGPPCFHLEEDGKFCLRSERWEGHPVFHAYVSLADLISTLI